MIKMRNLKKEKKSRSRSAKSGKHKKIQRILEADTFKQTEVKKTRKEGIPQNKKISWKQILQQKFNQKNEYL